MQSGIYSVTFLVWGVPLEGVPSSKSLKFPLSNQPGKRDKKGWCVKRKEQTRDPKTDKSTAYSETSEQVSRAGSMLNKPAWKEMGEVGRHQVIYCYVVQRRMFRVYLKFNQ